MYIIPELLILAIVSIVSFFVITQNKEAEIEGINTDHNYL